MSELQILEKGFFSWVLLEMRVTIFKKCKVGGGIRQVYFWVLPVCRAQNSPPGTLKFEGPTRESPMLKFDALPEIPFVANFNHPEGVRILAETY